MRRTRRLYKMNRIQANQAIIDIISQYAMDNPDMRFIQLLWSLGIINTQNDWLIEDRYNEESEDTLKKLKS